MKQAVLSAVIILVVGFSACTNQSNSNSQNKNDKKMENQVIEITYFKPKEGITQEAFKARNIRVGKEYAAKQPGFISRETAVDEDGNWVIVVHWKSMDDSKASTKKFGEDASVEDFVAMIEPSSFKMNVFTSKAFLK